MFRNEAFLDIFGFSFAAFACTVAWFVFYVKPHNQALYEVMDCMEEIGDNSEQGYNFCAQRISEKN
jgi:hypothetical protein